MIKHFYVANLILNRFRKMVPPVDSLREELNKIEEKLKGLDLPITFSHNDIWVNNFLYNRKTGIVSSLRAEVDWVLFQITFCKFILVK